MEYCPHCEIPFDPDNETQPCCGACGHPDTCSCSYQRGKGGYANNASWYFCNRLNEVLSENKSWHVWRDQVYKFQNQAGIETSKRQISIIDHSTGATVHVNFFKNGNTFVQGWADSPLGHWVEEALKLAKSAADGLPGGVWLTNDETWAWKPSDQW